MPPGARRIWLAAAALVVAAAMWSSTSVAEISQLDGVRVAVDATMTPTRLPRSAEAPIAVAFAARITAVKSRSLPKLTSIRMEINRHGKLRLQGIPRCRLGRIEPSTTSEALDACRSSLIGEGRFTSDVRIPEQSPFPSRGKVLAFNGRLRGHPVVFAHIYGTEPVPTSYVLPFTVTRSKGGGFGTALEAELPRVTGEWGYVTGISLRLDGGARNGAFLQASCPAPQGSGQASFSLARSSLAFAHGPKISTTLVRSCSVKR